MKKYNNRYLSIILSLVVMGAVFLLLYRSYATAVQERKQVEAECAAIEQEIAELDELIDEMESLREEKKETKEQVEFVLDHYALKISPETSIRFIRGLEAATGTTVRSLSFGSESAFFSSELQLTDTEETLKGYKSQIVISYETSYGNFKRLMDYIKDYPERMNVESVTASFNSATGYLSGTMTINLYRLEGTGREYEAPVEPDVPMGVENIFGTVR